MERTSRLIPLHAGSGPLCLRSRGSRSSRRRRRRRTAIIGFITPADLKHKRQRIDRLDGPTLFNRLMRRIGTLAEGYCSIPDGTPQPDYKALAAMAEQVVVREQDVRLREWERLSVRRGIKHPLAGLSGRALVTNIAEPLWPYLIVGQWVHVAKAASFGQGRYLVALQHEDAGRLVDGAGQGCCEASAIAPVVRPRQDSPGVLSRRRARG